MKCPVCDIEARITKSKNIMKGDKLYRRLTYSCLNPQCPKYNTVIGTEDVELQYDVVKEGETE